MTHAIGNVSCVLSAKRCNCASPGH